MNALNNRRFATLSRLFFSAAAITIAMASASTVRANLITNGDFSSPSQGGGYTSYYSGDSSSIPGWTTNSPNGDTQMLGPSYAAIGNGYGFPQTPIAGQQTFELFNDSGTGGVTQTISVSPGNYTISFDIGGRSGSASANLYIDGNATPVGTYSSVSGGDYAASSHLYHQTGTTLTLDFQQASGGALLQDVSVTVFTPEPSSFILCGLGAVGLLVAARRRRKA